MNTVTINWYSIKYAKLNEIENAYYFYAFSKGKVLLYIGIAYYQDVKTEIEKTLRAFKVNGDDISIWVGHISYSTYMRITEQIVKDVECLLIFKNQPLWNTQCKESYTGRPDLKIISHNFLLLMHSVIAPVL